MKVDAVEFHFTLHRNLGFQLGYLGYLRGHLL